MTKQKWKKHLERMEDERVTEQTLLYNFDLRDCILVC
jgi:hypothetical protein